MRRCITERIGTCVRWAFGPILGQIWENGRIRDTGRNLRRSSVRDGAVFAPLSGCFLFRSGDWDGNRLGLSGRKAVQIHVWPRADLVSVSGQDAAAGCEVILRSEQQTGQLIWSKSIWVCQWTVVCERIVYPPYSAPALCGVVQRFPKLASLWSQVVLKDKGGRVES